jgi:hypothetical protein
MGNAQIALEAASRVHQKVTSGAHSYSESAKSTSHEVIETAKAFLRWLEDNE